MRFYFTYRNTLDDRDKLYGNIVCNMQIEMSNLYFTCICNQLHLYLPQFTFFYLRFELHTV